MKYAVCVVGAGGTGSFFLKEFSRFIAGRKDVEDLIIFDGDQVERKNLSRQSFMEEDLGRSKAAVMAEALSEAFGLPWKAYPTYVTGVEDVTGALKAKGRYGREVLPVIVSCVDNHGCRMILEKAFQSYENCAYFDSANEYSTGEAVFSYRVGGKTIGPPRSFYFPDLLKGDARNRGEISCEELNRAQPQHIFTNMLAANLLCTGLSNLLSQKTTPGVCYFNAQRMTMQFVGYDFRDGEDAGKDDSRKGTGKNGETKGGGRSPKRRAS